MSTRETKSAANITNNDTAHLDSTDEENPQDFPDGGWQAWSVVLGSWCGMVPSFGLLNSIGVLQAWLANNQLKQYSESSIGWIFGVFTFFLYFTGIQIGERLRLFQL